MKGGSGEPQSTASSELGLNRIPELSNPTPRQALLEVGGQGWSVASPKPPLPTHWVPACPPKLQGTLGTDRNLAVVYFPRLQVEEPSDQEQNY